MDKLLRQYLEVATCRNVSHAAKKLCLTQPTLTHNMKKLEESLGVTLFTRSSSGISLTECGEVLLEQARLMRRLYDNTLIKLELIKERHVRELKLGTGYAEWHQFVRKTVDAYRQQHPSANLNIDVGNHLRLMDLLLSGDIDLFVGREIGGLSRKAEVKFLPLLSVQDRVYVRREHPLTLKPLCTPEDLVNYPTVEATPNESRYQHLIEDPQELKLFRSIHHLSEKIIYTSSSLLIAMDLVNDSNALLPFPASMAPYFSRFGLVSLPLKDPYSQGSVGVYLLREMSEDAHINDVLTLMRHYVQEQGTLLQPAAGGEPTRTN